MPHRSPRPRSAVLALLTGAAALAAAALPVLAPAAARASSAAACVALGDSYSSGVGAGSYIGSSGSCDQSTRAYPPCGTPPASRPVRVRGLLGRDHRDRARLPALRAQLRHHPGVDHGRRQRRRLLLGDGNLRAAAAEQLRQRGGACSPTCDRPSAATRSATPAAGCTRSTSWTSRSPTIPPHPASPAATSPCSAPPQAEPGAHHVGKGAVRGTSPTCGVRVTARPSWRPSAANSAEFTTAAPPGSLLK